MPNASSLIETGAIAAGWGILARAAVWAQGLNLESVSTLAIASGGIALQLAKLYFDFKAKKEVADAEKMRAELAEREREIKRLEGEVDKLQNAILGGGNGPRPDPVDRQSNSVDGTQKPA